MKYATVSLLVLLCVLGACEMPRTLPAGNVGDDGDDGGAEQPIDVDRYPNWERFPDAFQVTLMRGTATDPHVEGNSLDAFEAALEQGGRFVEVDFLMSKDDELIAAHHDNLGGDCGRVSRKTLQQLRTCRLSEARRVATLADLLAMPFEAIYIDLKESSRRSGQTLHDLVELTIDEIEEAERTDSAVLMLYDIDEQVAELIEERGIRAGLKGYPGGVDGVPEMLERASSFGLEMMCINAANLTPDLVHESARRGIWQLPWDHSRESNIPHWEELIRAGIGGLIVDNDSIVPSSAIEQWRDVRRQVDSASPGDR